MDFRVEPFVDAEIEYRRERAMQVRQRRDDVAAARAAHRTSRFWLPTRRR